MGGRWGRPCGRAVGGGVGSVADAGGGPRIPSGPATWGRCSCRLPGSRLCQLSAPRACLALEGKLEGAHVPVLMANTVSTWFFPCRVLLKSLRAPLMGQGLGGTQVGPNPET